MYSFTISLTFTLTLRGSFTFYACMMYIQVPACRYVQKYIVFSFYIFVSLLLRTLTFMHAWVKCIPGPLLLCANTCHRAALKVHI